MAKQRKKRRKTKLSPKERQAKRDARKFYSDIRTTFVNSGFTHVSTRDSRITVAGRDGEFDAVFIFENVLVILEDTATTGQQGITDHLRKKIDFFEHLQRHPEELLQVLAAKFPAAVTLCGKEAPYAWNEFQIRFVYCSRNTIDDVYLSRFGDRCLSLEYPYLRYFLTLCKTIHLTTRFELLKFLGVELADLGVATSRSETLKYKGLLLPETPSGFPAGHKLVSFLVDPNMLLEQAYVLRSESWRDDECLYQRLLSRGKIINMREFLVTQKRVFINNIIVTLPPESIVRDTSGTKITDAPEREIKPVTVEIPRRFNTVGIIDGQHRVFSYHEGQDKLDKVISGLREKQHLLLTGIIYPETMAEAKRQRFEANLFLEINDKQKRVKSDLKQAIEQLITPTTATAIAKAVITRLASTGPLTGFLEAHFFDVGKIKTASIVSYGMRHIVGLEAENSLYKEWRGEHKSHIMKQKEVLDRYIMFCCTELNQLFSAFKSSIDDELWTLDKKVSRVLTTTTINGLIFCLRKLIENGKRGDYDKYARAFGKLSIDFRPGKFTYKSSHWKDLGEEIYRQCF